MIPEEMRKEIEKSAQYINLSVDEAIAKFEEICSENSLQLSDPTAKALWRNFVANARRSNQSDNSNSNDSYYKNAFGFFVSLDAPRDMMSWNRARAREEFLRDSEMALETGVVAQAVETMGGWKIVRYHNGEHREAVMADLPEGAEILEDGRIYIPLDNTATYMNGGKNANYGKPLPKELMRRTGIFYGSLGAGGDMKPYFFSYKNQAGVDFAPETFTFVHFLCVEGSNGTDIYGAKDLTLNSLTLNTDMNPESELYRQMDNFDFESCLQSDFTDKLVPLVNLDREHLQRQGVLSKERYIITDGTVCNMNMIPTKNGNRIINITDLNAELDFENEAGTTTCWIPEHLTLDFGIGSTVIVVGRTSQRTTDEGTEPVTINVSGLLCTVRKGSAVEITRPESDEEVIWF